MRNNMIDNSSIPSINIYKYSYKLFQGNPTINGGLFLDKWIKLDC